MRKIYTLVDFLFRFILIFLFNFIWCTYFIKAKMLRWAISIGISLIICLLFVAIFIKKDKANKLFKRQKNHMSDVLNTLIYMPSFNVIDFFYRLASTKHDCTKNNKYITIKNQDGNVILYPHITPSKITLLDFSNIIKNVLGKNIKRLVVLCVDVENNIITELDKFGFDIVFLKNEEIYLKLLKKYEFYPEIIIKNVNKSKNTLKFLTTSALNKKRTKGYFLSALCLFFASFFNAYKIYYICVSSILILLAIFSWFNIKFNTAKEIKLLD